MRDENGVASIEVCSGKPPFRYLKFKVDDWRLASWRRCRLFAWSATSYYFDDAVICPSKAERFSSVDAIDTGYRPSGRAAFRMRVACRPEIAVASASRCSACAAIFGVEVVFTASRPIDALYVAREAIRRRSHVVAPPEVG